MSFAILQVSVQKDNTSNSITKKTYNSITKKTYNTITKETDNPIAKKTDNPIANKTDIPIANKTDIPIANKTDIPIANKTDNPIAKKTDNPIAKKTDNPIANKTDNPVAQKTDNKGLEVILKIKTQKLHHQRKYPVIELHNGSKNTNGRITVKAAKGGSAKLVNSFQILEMSIGKLCRFYMEFILENDLSIM